MNNLRHLPLLLTLALAGLPLARGAEPANPAEPPAAESAGPANPWLKLKASTYAQREPLFAGLPELAARVEAQLSELVAKRAALDASNTSTKDWDFAMQELGRAQTHLVSTSAELTKANRENWDQLKDGVGLAWDRTQLAYAKVKASTTN